MRLLKHHNKQHLKFPAYFLLFQPNITQIGQKVSTLYIYVCVYKSYSDLKGNVENDKLVIIKHPLMQW